MHWTRTSRASPHFYRVATPLLTDIRTPCRPDADHTQTPQQQQQTQLLQQQLSPHELAYQESLIQEREAEIREIESGIHELAEIFNDLGHLVQDQGQMLGALQYNFPLVCILTQFGRQH